MKIVYLVPGCGVSGGIAVICQHANRLQKRGYDVTLVSITPECKITWFPNQTVPVVTLDAYPQDVDILVATAWATTFTAARLNAARKWYFVQSDETRFHETDSSWQHITRLSYLMNFEFITEARWIQRWLKENFGQTAALIPNGLDPEIYHPVTPLVAKTAKKRILLEGAIGLPYKGMAEAFQAVSDLDVEVWCVSSYGRPKPQWRCDRFFENVPMKDMKRIYSSTDILLKLSRVEGFFGPPMEMMACGGNVVVGRVTGYDEYIVNGKNALVVDPLDIDAAKQAVKQLLDDPILCQKLTENGYRTAAEWTWDSSIDKLEEVISTPLSTRTFHHDAADEINRSISYFYQTLMSSTAPQPQNEPEELTTRQVIAEKLCLKLKQQQWFYPLAEFVFHAYRQFVRVRQQVTVLRINYVSQQQRLRDKFSTFVAKISSRK